ncbi:MAG: phenylalanine--tRNA ligase subunit beta [Alphaproteobacteria bacterium]
MKFSLSWLKKYLDTQETPQAIAEKLVELGLEVESLEDQNAALKGFVYARVVEREKHPNADRLSLCKVDAGGELVQVVCGAPNVTANMGVIFASVGTVIPITGEALKKGTIRNVESHGMLCSSRELLLGEDSDGIMDFGLNHKPGTPLVDIIKTDAVFDVAITPNRGDCFSVYGIARDLAASGIGKLKTPTIAEINEDCATPSVSILTPLCSQFSLRLIKGVKNTESPHQMQDLLTQSGQKPISGLVDITNYFCIGFGRPMHVFDADKIKGSLIVRQAKNGEVLKALNDQDYTLSEDMTVIADGSGVISLAGIMGGLSTAVDANTTNVLLEAAVFDPVAIAKTGQHLNLISDSRMRFERGVDAAIVLPCLDMATHMIISDFGGVAAKKLHIETTVVKPNVILLNPNHVQKRLGIEVNTEEMINIFKSLGCTVELDTSLKVTPPTWRHDLKIPEDLIEEVARLKGYGTIQAESLPLSPAQTVKSREDEARQHLVNRGFFETLNWSFIDKSTALKFSEAPQNLVKLANPISEDLSVMRPSLVASLLKVASFNNNNARQNGAIFEVAPVYGKNLTNKQISCVAGLRFGNSNDKHWLADVRAYDVFEAKADTLSVLKMLGTSESSLQISDAAPQYYHPGRKGALKQGNRTLAYFGEIHPSLTDGVNAVAFEIFVDNLHPAKARKTQNMLSDLMPVYRDFSFVLDASITSEKLIKAVEKASPLITNIDVFDCYQGTHVEQGKKSLAIAVTLQPLEKTLDEVALTQIHDDVISSAAKIGAVLR